VSVGIYYLVDNLPLAVGNHHRWERPEIFFCSLTFPLGRSSAFPPLPTPQFGNVALETTRCGGIMLIVNQSRTRTTLFLVATRLMGV
jgi:hypothetical protein